VKNHPQPAAACRSIEHPFSQPPDRQNRTPVAALRPDYFTASSPPVFQFPSYK
jgi:hypothetical protein